MINFKTPLSGFTSSDRNAASYIIAQQQQDMDNVVAYLYDLWVDDVDISKPHIFNAVLERYEFDIADEKQVQEIIRKVNAKIARKAAL